MFYFNETRKIRPKMTLSIFIKLMILGLLEPVIDQNLYFMGMKATTATFAAAMCNVLPAITFVMACILSFLPNIFMYRKKVMFRKCHVKLLLKYFISKAHNKKYRGKPKYMQLFGSINISYIKQSIRTRNSEIVLDSLRLEKVNMKSIRSHAKVIGTDNNSCRSHDDDPFERPVLELFWTKGRTHHQLDAKSGVDVDLHNSLMGAFMITVGCFSWSVFMVLQAITLKSYPAELSLTAWICLLGSVEGAIVALIMEGGKTTIWAINWDMSLVATLYSGIVCSGLAYYIQGLIMKVKDPVFVTAFSPLSMIIVAVMGSIILAEQMYLGRVIGAIVIVTGLYFVVWGKSKDDHNVSSEQMIPEKEFEEICCDKVITIQASYGAAISINEGVSDDHNHTNGLT
ncbi:hypothetical protein OSB04_009661 [Centaurea solstitialis]|uniref:WAT1-related protein n=1 Tax=Centaurea solstitialis TaxID=347529 RepID=A0AA38WC43_9ASTR|nr:hypothetical protein OSB04_009661 [Centaurea solstitialis]